MLNALLKETVLPLSRFPSSVRKQLNGILRIVDEKGSTCGLFFDKETLEELLEELESFTPEFWEEMERSRKSGDVSSQKVKARLGL